jgi:hypothetical protein
MSVFAMRKNFLVVLLGITGFCFLLISCDSGGSGGDVPNSIQGVWESGTVDSPEEDFIARLDLNQDGNDISGTLEVEFVESGQVDTFSILDGVYNAPDLDLTTETDATDGSTSESGSCTVESRSSMNCEIELGGQKRDIELTKQ